MAYQSIRQRTDHPLLGQPSRSDFITKLEISPLISLKPYCLLWQLTNELFYIDARLTITRKRCQSWCKHLFDKSPLLRSAEMSSSTVISNHADKRSTSSTFIPPSRLITNAPHLQLGMRNLRLFSFVMDACDNWGLVFTKTSSVCR